MHKSRMSCGGGDRTPKGRSNGDGPAGPSGHGPIVAAVRRRRGRPAADASRRMLAALSLLACLVGSGGEENGAADIVQFYQSQAASGVSGGVGGSHQKDKDGGGSSYGDAGEHDGGRDNNDRGDPSEARGGMVQLGSVHSSSYSAAFASSSSFHNPLSSSPGRMTVSNHCRPTSCHNVATYDLLPVLPNCREYVLCQKGAATLTFSCPEGMRFDTDRKKCGREDDVTCSCVSPDDAAAALGETAAIEESAAESTAHAVVGADPSGITPFQTAYEDVRSYELSTVCDGIRSSRLVPLLSTGCREYVNCFNGRVAQQQSCADGLLFDVTTGGCNWDGLVECAPYTMDEGGMGFSPANNPPTAPSPGGVFDVGDIGFGGNGGDNNLAIEPPAFGNMAQTQSIVDVANAEAEQLCRGQWSALLPLETMGCTYYVSCTDNAVSEILNCPENTLFDIAINGCNWEYMVDCPTMSPTRAPTEEPTGRPTLRPVTMPPPTSRPVADPTPRPTPSPTPRRTPPPTQATARPTPRPTAGAAAPDLFDWLQDHRRQLNQEVFRSYTQDGTAYRSYWFQYQDFFAALRLVAGGGPGNAEESITGLEKHKFWIGDEASDFEYGLVNVAAFLAHAVTESITNDACAEFHWEKNTDASSVASGKGGNNNHYAISNACGQNGQNYQEYQCAAEESHMACEVDRNLILQATTSSVYPNAPPPLSCRPRSTGESFTGYWDVGQGKELTFFPYENSFGRTDVEGCCYWGRGAIHSKGVCNLGKINYYLGKRANDEGRKSRYPTTDFCAFPEAICSAPESREMRWVTSFFEWTERVQSYDDFKGWNYIRKLKEFVDHGLVDFEFLEATSGILTKGCHEPPCVGSSTRVDGGWGSGDIHLAEERVKNFQTILIALEAGGEEALLRALIKYFTDRQDVMNSQILRSQTPEGQLYPSYRYQLPDFLSAMTYMSETGVGGRKFYTGEVRVPEGVRYGVVNAVMFLAQAYKEAIQYDACDENNWQLVNDRFPLSNACGQLGMSYQDMHCREDEAYMECPVQRDMEQVALTSAQWFQAPAPFKCGPRTKYPLTGFWDYDLGRENNEDAYANARGRVDVEGCCWWGRGIIQTRGTCNYGKLNYHLGKRAADEGRPSLYPDIDFCDFPQGVCSSDETYGGELQWMVGYFEWADRIQTYDVDGWNYIQKLKEFVDGGYKDFAFVDAVSGILNIGCHNPPCKGFGDSAVEPHNKRDRNDTFQRFLNQLQVARTFRPPPKPTPMPSPVPTDLPTPGEPTTAEPTVQDPPTEMPTITAQPTALQGRPPEEAVDEMDNKIGISKVRFSELLLVSEHPTGEMWPSYLYTWRGFEQSLKKMTTGVGPGEKNFFYIGDGYSSNSLAYGLANIAAFIAESTVQSIYYDACDENSWEMVNYRYPIANSCGQEGKNYQDFVCEGDEEGMECEVDLAMEIRGVTHARWVGAPPPMYCGDRQVGFWDHITGLEEHDPPYKNKRGRSDIKGCCWWGRGALQVKGVCEYGKLNHWLGAKAAADGRPSIYPDIDFCKNPGVICSDTRRSAELRWITGMFHWVQTVQRSKEYDYFPRLKTYVDSGDFKNDGSFIGMVNAMLGGRSEDVSRRTSVFFDAMKAFNLITVESNTTSPSDHTFCGVGWNDAASRCISCETNADCSGAELCYDTEEPCEIVEDSPSDEAGNMTVEEITEEGVAGNTTEGANITAPDSAIDNAAMDNATAADVAPIAMSSSTTTTNYCGATWGDAANNCAIACPSGMNQECPPGLSCFGDITSCANANQNTGVVASTTSNNYCGPTWGDAAASCSNACPGGNDAECPAGHKCFGDIHC